MFQYSIKQLIQVRDFFRKNPKGIVNVPNIWPNSTFTKDEWHKWFRNCLNEKINWNQNPIGRKDTSEWRLEMKRAQWEINNPRLIIGRLPSDLKKRFSYRLRENIID